MSKLPKGWSQIKLADIATLRTGPFGSSLHQSDYVTDGVPLINPMHIVEGQLVPSPNTTVSVGTAERLSEYRLKLSDIVIGRRGEMGRCAVVRPHSEGWLCGTGSLIIRPLHGRLSSDFLQYFLAHDRVVGYLMSASVGSTMANLNQQLLLDLDVCLPPAEEQTRIVAKLEELLSDLDAGVAELKAVQKKLLQYRRSLLKAAVEGALTASWREARSAANTPLETGAQLLERILCERRVLWEEKQLAKFKEQGKTPPKDWQKKYPEPVAPHTNSLPELPEGWTWASVDQLSPDDLANGRSVPTADAGAKVLRLTAIKDGMVDLQEYKLGSWSDEDAKPFAVTEGDLLIVRGNGSLHLVGRAGLVRSVSEQIAYPDTMIRLRVVESVASPSWIELVWDSHVVRGHLERRARTSAGIYKIAQTDIVSAVVPIPSLLEQAQIQEAFAVHLAQISATQTALETSLKQSTAQRQNILHAAFTGQLVPQDPNDEPASVLLERIRTERAAQAATKKPRGRKTAEAAA